MPRKARGEVARRSETRPIMRYVTDSDGQCDFE